MVSDLFIRIRFWFGGGDDNNNSGSGTFWLIIAIVAAILAPIIATLVQLAISRKREFLADSTGALMTRYPEGLASALEKISQYKKPMQRVSSATSHLFISNPFGKTTSSKLIEAADDFTDLGQDVRKYLLTGQKKIKLFPDNIKRLTGKI